MDVPKILSELRLEREEIERHILSLEQSHSGRKGDDKSAGFATIREAAALEGNRMDIPKILSELRLERERIEREIFFLEQSDPSRKRDDKSATS